MKILVTGFDPFGGESINPSAETVKALPDRIGDAQIVKQILPTVFGKAGNELLEAIQRHRPDTVVCIGQAGGRNAITPERIAVNLRDASIPDNEGNRPEDQPIRPQGQIAYFSTLPIKQLVSHLKRNRIPASVSNTAGTFVCNEVMYLALEEASKNHSIRNAGFVHIPYTKEQAVDKPAGTPYMEADEILRGITELLKAICELRQKESSAEL